MLLCATGWECAASGSPEPSEWGKCMDWVEKWLDRLVLVRDGSGPHPPQRLVRGWVETDDVDCRIGEYTDPEPPYETTVYADEALSEDEQIAFNAGSHAELIRMDYEVFMQLVEPVVASLSGARR